MADFGNIYKIKAEDYNLIKAEGGEQEISTGDSLTYDENSLYLTTNSRTLETRKVTIDYDGGNGVSNNYSICSSIYYEITYSLTSVPLTLHLIEPPSGLARVYNVRFYVGSTIPSQFYVISDAYSVFVWPLANPETLNSYTYYELNIVEDVATLTPISNKFGLYTLVENYYPSAGTLTVYDTSTNTAVSDGILYGDKTYRVNASAGAGFSVSTIYINGKAVSSNYTFKPSGTTTIITKFTSSTTNLEITNNAPTSGVSRDIYVYRNRSNYKLEKYTVNPQSTETIYDLEIGALISCSASPSSSSGVTAVSRNFVGVLYNWLFSNYNIWKLRSKI